MTTAFHSSDKTLAALIHLSAFSPCLIPFGNFIIPLVLWLARKNDPFMDRHARTALNFQISMYLYVVSLGLLAAASFLILGVYSGVDNPFRFPEILFSEEITAGFTPFFVWIMSLSAILLGLVVVFIYGVVQATIKAGEGQLYTYPLSINFLGLPKKESLEKQE